MDDNLEYAHVEFLRKIETHELSGQEARAILPVLNARLELLRSLRSRMSEDAEFAEQASDVQQEIKSQSEEIALVERYVELCNQIPGFVGLK
jgi:hypothetical protein